MAVQEIARMIGAWLRRYAERDGRGYPDWAMRYAPITRCLRRIRPTARRIAEIGANANGFARFAHLPVIAVDRDSANLREARSSQSVYPVLADACALPLGTGSVDVCICMDTLEHLPHQSRETALREITRVLAHDGVAVVAFPSGEAAARAESEIREAYRRFAGTAISWLEQHAALGLPNAGAVRAALAAYAPGRRITMERNTPVCVWRWMWRILLCGWPGRGNALFQALLRLMTPLLTHCHAGTCYRSILWVEPEKDAK